MSESRPPFARAALLALAFAAGLVTASPAAASSQAAGPLAHAAGGDAPSVIPAIVRTRVKRTERALDRLSDAVDDGDAAQAARSGKIIRRQVSSAWRGAKYYIRHAPPPADEARVSGDGGGGTVVADAPTAALAVFQLHDQVVSDVVELTDGARGATLRALSATLFFVLDRRDAAIEDVRALAPPAADDDALVLVHARASGDGEAVTFDLAMPQVTAMLDDEMQQIDGLQSDAVDLSAGGRRTLGDAAAQILLTRRKVNSYWPPQTDD